MNWHMIATFVVLGLCVGFRSYYEQAEFARMLSRFRFSHCAVIHEHAYALLAVGVEDVYRHIEVGYEEPLLQEYREVTTYFSLYYDEVIGNLGSAQEYVLLSFQKNVLDAVIQLAGIFGFSPQHPEVKQVPRHLCPRTIEDWKEGFPRFWDIWT